MKTSLETKFFWTLLAGVALFFGLLTWLLSEREGWLMMVVYGVLLGLLSGAFLIIVLRRLVLRPLKALHSGAEEISRGRLSHRVNITTNDEMGALAKAFNRMAEELEASRTNLESDVRLKTDELKAIAELSASVFRGGLGGGLGFEEIIELYLGTLTRTMGYSSAALCFLDRETGTLAREHIKGEPLSFSASGLPLSGGDPIAKSLRELTAAVVAAPGTGGEGPHGNTAVVPVIAPFRRRCRDVLECDLSECPAYGSDDDRCWLIKDTLCRSPMAVAADKKLEGCVLCRVFPIRGVLLAENEGVISPSSLDSIEILAATLSSALENLELIESGRKEISSLLRLHDIYVEEVRHLNMDSLIKSTVTYATAFAGVEAAALWRTDNDGIFRLADASKIDKALIPACISDDGTGVSKAIAENRMVETFNINEIQWARELSSRHKLTYMAAVPLNFEGRSFGCLTLFKTKSAPMTDSERAVVALFTKQSAAAINAATVYGRLHDQKEFSDTVFNNMTMGIMVIDRGGSVIRINRAGNSILGIKDDDLVGRPITEVLPGSEAFVESSGDLSLEMDLTIGGKTVPIGFHSSPFMDWTRQTAGIIVVFRDITEIKKLRRDIKERHHMEAMGKVVAGVAHEIRNPLFAISSVAQILEKEIRNEEHRGLLGALLKEVGKMKHIIEEFVLYSRPSKLNPAPLALTPFMDVLRDYATSLDSGVSVTLCITPKGLNINADQKKLALVFRNFVDNSLMAGAGSIAVSAYKEDGSAVISFTDDGRGIEARDLDKAFEPFFTTRKEGTGLGLSICRKIIEDHGGSVSITSEPGKGATVRVSLKI